MIQRLSWIRRFSSSSWENGFLTEVYKKENLALLYFSFISGTVAIPLTYLDFVTLEHTPWQIYAAIFDSAYVILCYLITILSWKKPLKDLRSYILRVAALTIPLSPICGTLTGFYPPDLAIYPLLSVILTILFIPVIFTLPLEKYFLITACMVLLYFSSAWIADMFEPMNPAQVSQVVMSLLAFFVSGCAIYFPVHHYRLRDFYQRKDLEELYAELKNQKDHLEELVEDRYRELLAENRARKEAETRLEETAQRYRTIVEHSFQAILETDEHGMILAADFSQGNFLGYRVEEVLGRYFGEFADPPRSHPEPISLGEPWRRQRLRTRSRSGQEAWLDLVIGSYKTRDGENHSLIIAQDITYEVHLERRLEIQNRIATLGMLAEGIAHDLKNSLTLLFGVYDFMRDFQESTSPKTQEFIGLLGNELLHLKHLVEDLLGFGREHRKITEPVHLDQFFREFYPFLRRILPETIELKIMPVNSLVILAHPIELKNILLNLAINARDAMPHGGVLTLAAAQKEEKIRITVTDSGEGIPPEILGRIFDPFFTTKPPDSGAGLGLTLVKEWMERWGGRVEVASVPGKGTTVYLDFPLPDPTLHPGLFVLNQERKTDTVEIKGKKIMIVEDAVEVRWLIATILQRSHFPCDTAATISEALEKLKEDHYDLVISDYLLRSGKGSDLAEMIARRFWPRPRFLLMTGYTAGGIAELRDSPYIDGILEKPFTSEELLRKIMEIFAE